ncbi:Hypothetical protein D9617_25g061940 [Elsinoe fawcettii]|nr:Hypothetical protein D9617_25g061940 [Elsinoe fawcettii]
MELPLSDPSLPSPPFIHCPGLANLRDIGGYPIHSPSFPTIKSVRRGVLYRSADPSRITPEGLSLLSDLGITTVFDLRSMPEIQRVGAEWGGVGVDASPFYSAEESVEARDEKKIERIWTPVFPEQDYSPEKVGLRYKAYTKGAEGFRDAYKDILSSAGEAYGTILRFLARGEGRALVHCTAGKDRTGMLVAVLFGLLGVEGETIAREYALTDEGLRLMKPIFKERLLRNEALKGNEDGVENMISSRAENMRVTLELVEEVWGGPERYLRDVVRLSDGEIEALKRRFGSEEEPVL